MGLARTLGEKEQRVVPQGEHSFRESSDSWGSPPGKRRDVDDEARGAQYCEAETDVVGQLEGAPVGAS